MKKVFAIIGSASGRSANLQLVEIIAEMMKPFATVTIYDRLKELPHFDPELSVGETPDKILAFRNDIEKADVVIICTPEYVFSIPSGLKNAIEWCVSTTVFTKKAVAIVTASAHGVKGHEELKMIMRTLDATLSEEAMLLIQGIKGKINSEGKLTHPKTNELLHSFVSSLQNTLTKDSQGSA